MANGVQEAQSEDWRLGFHWPTLRWVGVTPQIDVTGTCTKPLRGRTAGAVEHPRHCT